jgi:hypothetical protein
MDLKRSAAMLPGQSGARAMDVLFPYALWTLVSLIVIGSGIALLVW